jgi:hypothetical protein
VAIGGEHSAGDREREHGAEPLGHVVDRGGLAHLIRGDGVKNRGGHGR